MVIRSRGGGAAPGRCFDDRVRPPVSIANCRRGQPCDVDNLRKIFASLVDNLRCAIGARWRWGHGSLQGLSWFRRPLLWIELPVIVAAEHAGSWRVVRRGRRLRRRAPCPLPAAASAAFRNGPALGRRGLRVIRKRRSRNPGARPRASAPPRSRVVRRCESRFATAQAHAAASDAAAQAHPSALAFRPARGAAIARLWHKRSRTRFRRRPTP